MPVLDSRMRSLGLSENQVSVVMAVRRKGKNLTHALQHRTRKNTMLEQLQERVNNMRKIAAEKRETLRQTRMELEEETNFSGRYSRFTSVSDLDEQRQNFP